MRWPVVFTCRGRIAVLIVFVLSNCLVILAQSSSNLEAIRTKHRLPGLAAARVSTFCHGNLTAEAVGVRKIGHPARLTAYDKFHLGSLTKAMTATLIAILINDPANNLTWNSTVWEALPHLHTNMSSHYKNTTLMMLASHRAGLNDTAFILSVPQLWLSLFIQTYPPIQSRQLVVEHVLASPPATPPGQGYLYSNLGYVLLGHLLDMHNPGGGWEDAMRRSLWKPLGMTQCGFGPVPQGQDGEPKNPWPHAAAGPNRTDPVPVPWDTDNPSALGPAGTVHCTIASYARFLQLHLDAMLGCCHSRLLPHDAFRVLHTPYRLLTNAATLGGTGDVYTPGAWLFREENIDDGWGKHLLHDGSNTVNYAWAIVAPKRQAAFFTGTNVGEASRAMSEVASGLLNGTLGLE